MDRKNKHTEPRNRNQRIRLAVTACLVLIILISAGAIIGRQIRGQSSEAEYDKIRKETLTETKQEATGEKTAQEEQTNEEKAQEPDTSREEAPKVDFEELREQNEDICAWISIPGTQIDYPVLRNGSSKDPYDAYYLEHNVDKSQGRPGTIYMEPCNAGEFTDFNTVLYGHNMRNGTMFADLHKYEDSEFVEENNKIYIVTPEETLTYQIFGVVKYDNRHIMASFDFSNEKQRRQFLDSLKENPNGETIFWKGDAVSPDSRMITLSTCFTGNYDFRLLVTAVLTK